LAERHSHRKRHAGKPSRAAQQWTLRHVGPAGWELVPPPSAAERAEDLAEVQAMLTAGEVEIARDELLWLLEGCHEFLDAHRLLGELALAEVDLSLARGHFGYAYRLGQRAIEQADASSMPISRTVPYQLSANQSFHESGKGLVWCLLQLKMSNVAAEVADFLIACDPADPLGVRKLLAADALSAELREDS
jgi:hypothetical protein